jgi:spore coat protein A, manganese oxidase
MISRRLFLKATAATGVVASAGGFLTPRRAHAFYQSPGIPLFVNTLRSIDTIPVAAPDLTPAPVTGVTHYTIGMSQYTDQIVPAASGLGPTTLWGYHPARVLVGSASQKHLGGIIVGQKGSPIQLTMQNKLPTVSNAWGQIHPLPVDGTISQANQAQNRAAVHLHGGLVPWISDGGPFDWFDPTGNHGLSFRNNEVLNPAAKAGEAEYYYPLHQSARFMWYHDHAVGITRLNAYAGIATGLIVRDNFEGNLRNLGLPDFIENLGHEIPLIFQDKIFVGSSIRDADPTWTGATNPGSLWYAHTYEQSRWDEIVGPLGAPPAQSSIPEFFGDTMLVNGTAFPEATVEARRYRLRMLNACNARFLNLQLYEDDGSENGISLHLQNPKSAKYGTPTNKPFVNAATGRPAWLQIGTEGGFLSTPAEIPSDQPLVFQVPPDPISGQTNPSKIKHSLIVAPAERPDLIVDFSGYAGKKVVLYNDAPAPFPSGDDRNDYFPGWNVGSGTDGIGNPVNGTTLPGNGPNTRVLMRFTIVPAQAPADKKLRITKDTPLSLGLDPFLLPPTIHSVPSFFRRRYLTLNEYHDAYGRLIQILGNAQAPFGSPYDGMATYADYPPASKPADVGATEEHVEDGQTEVWEIFNTTGDVHPMHFHLVNVQIINRQLYNTSDSPPDPRTSPYGPILPPDPNEEGWKETVPMYPGTVTRVIMKFDVPKIVSATNHIVPTPVSLRTGGFEYVWHCHILEHEEHDMMHALVVR